jgi:hypothetical protein
MYVSLKFQVMNVGDFIGPLPLNIRPRVAGVVIGRMGFFGILINNRIPPPGRIGLVVPRRIVP